MKDGVEGLIAGVPSNKCGSGLTTGRAHNALFTLIDRMAASGEDSIKRKGEAGACGLKETTLIRTRVFCKDFPVSRPNAGVLLLEGVAR